MKDIGRVMGEWLKTYGFNQIATIRTHYSLKEHHATKIAGRLVKSKNVDIAFISIEPDRDDNHKHGHLLFRANGKWDRQRLAKEIGVNPKAIPYCNPVKHIGDVEVYCSKHVYRPFSFHDIHY